jgi:hypothetical protein
MHQSDLEILAGGIAGDTTKIRKWTILRHVDGVFAVQEHNFVDGKWNQVGITLRWTYIDAVLEHIKRIEAETK